MTNICPICGKDNHCAYLSGKPHKECWCNTVEVPKEIFDLVPENKKGKDCICLDCVNKFKQENKI